jgi:uncharacterized protein with HEPN domain
MPKKRDDNLLLEDILEHVQDIREFVLNMDLDDFLSDKKTRAAVTRDLQIIGEASKALSEPTKAQMPMIPWHKIAGFRNRIVHDYLNVSYKTVWLIVQHELAPLEKAIQEFKGV